MSCKEVTKLISGVRFVGKKYGDVGTYEETIGGHSQTIIKFRLNGVPFRQAFCSTPGGGRTLLNVKSDVKRKLRLCGLDDPSLSVNMFTSMTTPSFLESFYSYLNH